MAPVVSLYNHRYTATQFALLSSVKRSAVSAFSVACGEAGGRYWRDRFSLSPSGRVPVLWLLWYLRKPVADHADVGGGLRVSC